MRAEQSDVYARKRETLVRAADQAAWMAVRELAAEQAKQIRVATHVLLAQPRWKEVYNLHFHREMDLAAHAAGIAPHPDEFRSWCDHLYATKRPSTLPPFLARREMN